MKQTAPRQIGWQVCFRIHARHLLRAIGCYPLLLGVFLLAFLLAGCGGASSESQVLPPTRIAMYGDSTTAGWSWNGTSYVILADNEPAIVQTLLQARCPSMVVTVANEEVVGASLENLLAGTGGYTQSWTHELAAGPADIVVFNFCINDSYEAGMTVQKFDGEVRQTISEGQAAGKLMVIETSNPIAQNTDVLFPQLVADERPVAAELHVPLIDQYAYLSQFDWSSYL